MKIELARAGSHNGVVLTPEDLSGMAENFVSDVPVTIGHEADDSMPAYGWVKSVELSADGNLLIGEIEMGQELAEAFAEGRYKNWSIGAARNDDDMLYLHHVAFLGAVPPMIKGLKVIEMGDRSRLVTFSAVNCGFVFSDREMAEYSRLKSADLAEKIGRLAKEASGKLPFGKKEALIGFVSQVEKNHPELNFADFLTDLFKGVKQPVQMETLRTQPQTKTNIFSKI